ncbi:MAG: hypothetical protein WBV46_09055, partial [Terriglobales bacterium]
MEYSSPPPTAGSPIRRAPEVELAFIPIPKPGLDPGRAPELAAWPARAAYAFPAASGEAVGDEDDAEAAGVVEGMEAAVRGAALA